MLMRWEVLVQTGGFDERFFMYSEEMDLCKTATAGGWQVWFVPEAQVTHLEGHSSIQNVAARHINFNTSRVSYIRKHHGRFTGWWLRQFLLMTYRFQYIEEGFKFLVRHKPELRRERLQMIRRVRASRLLPGKYPRPPLTRGVCLLSAEFPTQPGGVGDYTECLAREFAKSFETLVITGTHNSGPEKPEYPLAHPVEVWNWRSLRRIADYLAEHPCSVLNIQYQTGAYQMHPAVNFLPFYLRQRTGNARPKVVTTFHDLRPPYLFPKAGPARKWVTRFLMKCSDAAVVTNYEDYRTALGWGVSGQKLWLVPIGSNISPLTPPVPEERAVIRAHWKIKPDDFLIGYFGLLNHSKGVDVLLDAFSLLKTEPGWKLLIIGGSTGETDKTNQPYALQLTAQIERLELFERVIWTGYLPPDQTSQALYALDAAALPFRDGLSLRRGSLLAALSHGVPVLTTEPDASHKPEPGSVPGYSRLPEMQLLLDRSVLTVKVGDATGLAEALRKLRGEPDLRRRLSEASLEFSSHIRWSEIARSLLEVYTAC
jgi:glycosyltransferase involved in cell wall biosynthesis